VLLNHDQNLFFSSRHNDDLAMSKNVAVLIFYKKNVTCYNQMIVAIADVLTSFIFIFTDDNH
jgi:hypothetical protein